MVDKLNTDNVCLIFQHCQKTKGFVSKSVYHTCTFTFHKYTYELTHPMNIEFF